MITPTMYGGITMMKRAAYALCLALTLAGCDWNGNSSLANSSLLESIAEKRTTLAEVRALLGEPHSAFTDIGGDTVWGYHYVGNLFSDNRFVSVIVNIRDGVVLSKDVSRF